MEELLTAKEVAKLLRVNEKKVYELIRKEGIPSVRVSGKWLFPKKELMGWLKERVELGRDLLLVGSDDPLIMRFLGEYARKKDFQSVVFYSAIGSEAGLRCLREGKADGCCCHMLDVESGEYNIPFLKRSFPEGAVVAIVLWYRRQGLILKKGNPLGIKGLKDVQTKGARFVNRKPGSGTRLLVDWVLSQEGIRPEELRGYHEEASSHLEVALRVLLGEADVGIGIEYVAHLFGLDFLPLREERFDLVLSEKVWGTRKVKDFLDFILQSQKTLSLPGYSFRDLGKVILV